MLFAQRKINQLVSPEEAGGNVEETFSRPQLWGPAICFDRLAKVKRESCSVEHCIVNPFYTERLFCLLECTVCICTTVEKYEKPFLTYTVHIGVKRV